MSYSLPSGEASCVPWILGGNFLVQAKLEQQHVWKQLQKAMQAVIKMQQEKQMVDQRQYWVNALKYVVYKGEIVL